MAISGPQMHYSHQMITSCSLISPHINPITSAQTNWANSTMSMKPAPNAAPSLPKNLYSLLIHPTSSTSGKWTNHSLARFSKWTCSHVAAYLLKFTSKEKIYSILSRWWNTSKGNMIHQSSWKKSTIPKFKNSSWTWFQPNLIPEWTPALHSNISSIVCWRMKRKISMSGFTIWTMRLIGATSLTSQILKSHFFANYSPKSLRKFVWTEILNSKLQKRTWDSGSIFRCPCRN